MARGEEYKDARKIAVGDLNHDGVADTAVLYTIESQGGSNNYTQYLAVFVRSKSALKAVAHVAVGGKSYRSVELTSVSDNTIHLDTLDYAPKDAACCPSKKGATDYVLVGAVLREKKRPHAQSRHNERTRLRRIVRRELRFHHNILASVRRGWTPGAAYLVLQASIGAESASLRAVGHPTCRDRHFPALRLGLLSAIIWQ